MGHDEPRDLAPFALGRYLILSTGLIPRVPARKWLARKYQWAQALRVSNQGRWITTSEDENECRVLAPVYRCCGQQSPEY